MATLGGHGVLYFVFVNFKLFLSFEELQKGPKVDVPFPEESSRFSFWSFPNLSNFFFAIGSVYGNF